jgi:hypothetical protein
MFPMRCVPSAHLSNMAGRERRGLCGGEAARGRGCMSDGLGGQASVHDGWTREAGGGRHWIGKHICAG